MKNGLVFSGWCAACRVAVACVSVGLVMGMGSPVAQNLGNGQYRVTFTYKAPPGTQTVHVAGTFNGWDKSAMAMPGPDQDGRFSVTVQIEQGYHEYKFVVDGQHWQTDPDNPNKTGPHDNAVLLLGVDGELVGSGVVRPTPEVDMAARAPHPPEVASLIAALQSADIATAPKTAADWLSRERNPMPLMMPDSVTWVALQPKARELHLLVHGRGFWTSYRFERPVAGVPLFVGTLKRDQIPEGAVYNFDLATGGRSDLVTDPFAWTITSRGGQPVADVAEPDPRRGRIRLLHDVKPSSGALRSRDIYVYCPPGYDAQSQRRYPVVYMHDGQNCWDDPDEPFGHGGWHVNTTVDRLIAGGTVEPFIVVGVSNTPERMEEYGPGSDIASSDTHRYIQYLLRDVKPLVDKRFRTKPGPADTALMGSSMGGIISLQAALLNPGVFGKIACLSPAFSFKDARGRNYFDLLAVTGKVPVRVYIDSGTAGPGQDGAAETRRMGEALAEAGWRDTFDLLRHEAAGAEHNERAWRARLDKPLTFLFGKVTEQEVPSNE